MDDRQILKHEKPADGIGPSAVPGDHLHLIAVLGNDQHILNSKAHFSASERHLSANSAHFPIIVLPLCSEHNKCIYVFNDNQLLFYSNENDCSFNQLNRYINYISECLNGLFVKDEKGYNEFIKNSKEYHPNEENVTIYKEIDNMTFHLGSEYNSNNFRQYYCLYYYDIDIDLSSYGIDVPSGFTSGFKGSWDGNQKKTVYTRSFSYTFNNSILTITFDKEKSQEVLKVQKVHNRTLQNGDKIYLNESPFTVQIENTPI